MVLQVCASNTVFTKPDQSVSQSVSVRNFIGFPVSGVLLSTDSLRLGLGVNCTGKWHSEFTLSSKILPMIVKTPRSRSNVPKSATGLSPVRSAVGLSVAHAGIASSLRYIYKNYDRPIKVMDLGDIAGLSRRGYFKAFQRHVGLRPAQVLRHLRIERAKQLLRENKLSLCEIGPQCGYPRVNSFWVAFRQTTGLSPGQFQRQARSAHGLGAISP